MKALQIIAIGVTLFVMGYVIGYRPQFHSDEKFISIDSLESRVFAQYGEGDDGVEEMLYLTTGVKQDFMGNPIEDEQEVEFKFDYCVVYYVDITDKFTVVYDKNHKFVTTVPYVEGSAWDEAMSWENL